MPTVSSIPHVVGTGTLRDAITRALDERGRSTDLVVAASDAWDTTGHAEARRLGTERRVPWLPVRVELGTVVIGPLERPGIPGCPRCAQTRRHRARDEAAWLEPIRDRHGERLRQRRSAMLTGLAAEIAAALVADEADADSARTHNALLYLHLDRLTVSRHPFLPDPLCADRGDLPADRPELAVFDLARRPKPDRDTYRVRDMLTERDRLLDTYTDAETGVMRPPRSGTSGGLVVASTMLAPRSQGEAASGHGRARAFHTSEMTAVLEALERYGGLEPGGKRTVVRARFTEIVDRALDPRTLGTHSADDYATPGYPFQRFDEERLTRWVWGFSFARQEPILVPETCAYYALDPARTGDTPLFCESSNGCALGGCLEEAILYGLLEAIERDATMLTWYARLPAPPIDLTSAADRMVPLQAAAISAQTRSQIVVLDTTPEHGIPCVWATAIIPTPDSTGYRAACAASAHPSAERATLNALSELGPHIAELIRNPPDRERVRLMAADPAQVTTMDDHRMLYGAPETFDRLSFLTDTAKRPQRTLTQPSDDLRNNDLSDDLRTLINRLLAQEMDVIVVDQTTPEHRATNLACAKVLVPGLAPITFGHRYRRTENLPRLLDLPHKLGYRTSPLRHEELNPHPHPFA